MPTAVTVTTGPSADGKRGISPSSEDNAVGLAQNNNHIGE